MAAQGRIQEQTAVLNLHGEIASLLGLSEETVCRQMAKMRRRGILYAPRGKIEILDWDQLQAVADEVCLEVA